MILATAISGRQYVYSFRLYSLEIIFQYALASADIHHIVVCGNARNGTQHT